MYFTDLCYAVELEQYLWDYFGKFSFVLLSLLVGNRITRYTVANTQILLLYVIFVVQIAYTDNLIVTIMNNCQFWTVTIELDILPDIESHKPWYYLGVNSIKYFHLTASSWIHVISILHCADKEVYWPVPPCKKRILDSTHIFFLDGQYIVWYNRLIKAW